MAILATLGDIAFEVLSNDFRKFDQSSGWNFPEHQRLEGKPTLQQVGGELQKISFDFIFHRQLVDPELALNEIREAAEKQQPLSLVFGETYQGQWVIVSLKESPQRVGVQDGSAKIDIIEFSINLKQFKGLVVEPAKTQEQDSFEYAFDENGITTDPGLAPDFPPLPPPTPPTP